MLKFHFLVTLIIFIGTSCSRIQVYPEPNSPQYLNNNISNRFSISDSTICIASFNIEKSLKVDLAITEFLHDSSFSKVDILLLQEVSIDAVTKYSKSLGLNYLYYPIAINTSDGSEFGNAILSKFTISQVDKLILPHQKRNGRIRNATNCVIDIPDLPILVYSVHMETIVMNQDKRMEQVDALIHDIERKKSNTVIIGGDFNTLIDKDLEIITEKFAQSGIQHDSDHIGYTGKYLLGLIKPANDHFFSRNTEVIETIKMKDSKSSDHLPILIKYRIL